MCQLRFAVDGLAKIFWAFSHEKKSKNGGCDGNCCHHFPCQTPVSSGGRQKAVRDRCSKEARKSRGAECHSHGPAAISFEPACDRRGGRNDCAETNSRPGKNAKSQQIMPRPRGEERKPQSACKN